MPKPKSEGLAAVPDYRVRTAGLGLVSQSPLKIRKGTKTRGLAPQLETPDVHGRELKGVRYFPPRLPPLLSLGKVEFRKNDIAFESDVLHGDLAYALELRRGRSGKS